MKTILYLFILSFSIVSYASAQDRVPEFTIGAWAGHMYQEGHLDPYWVAISIKEGELGEVTGHVEYGNAMCSGDLIFIGFDQDGNPQFQENITHKINRCFNNGIITFYHDEIQNKYAISWRHPNDYLFSAANAILDKASQ